MNRVLLFICLSCFGLALNAQISDLRGGGALLSGQARISSVLDPDHAIYGNIAAMAWSDLHWQAYASGERRFGFEDLSLYSLSGMLRFGKAAAGIQLADFGDIDYKERRIQASYAMQLADFFSMGASFNLYHLTIADYGQSFTPTVDIGIYSKVLPSIYLGAHVQNIVPSSQNTAQYPSIITLGINYKASDKVDFKVEAEKILDRNLAIKAAIMYRPIPELLASLGVDAARETVSLCLAYQFSSFRIAGAYSGGSRLGSSPALNLGYFKKKSVQTSRNRTR